MNDIPSSLYHLDLSFLLLTITILYSVNEYLYTHLSKMNEYYIFTTKL